MSLSGFFCVLQPLHDDRAENNRESCQYPEDIDEFEIYERCQDKKEHDKSELAEQKHLRPGFLRAKQPLHSPGEAPEVQKPEETAGEDAERESFPFNEGRERRKGDEKNKGSPMYFLYQVHCPVFSPSGRVL